MESAIQPTSLKPQEAQTARSPLPRTRSATAANVMASAEQNPSETRAEKARTWGMATKANPFRKKVRRLKGRAVSGDWLRAVHLDHTRELQSILSLMERGGRFNPPGRFPVLHAVED